MIPDLGIIDGNESVDLRFYYIRWVVVEFFLIWAVVEDSLKFFFMVVGFI